MAATSTDAAAAAPSMLASLGGGGAVEISLNEPEQRPEHRGALMDALRDAYAEAKNAFEPRLRSWLLTLSRVTFDEAQSAAEGAARTSLLERVTTLRARLREGMARAEVLLEGSVTGVFVGIQALEFPELLATTPAGSGA